MARVLDQFSAATRCVLQRYPAFIFKSEYSTPFAFAQTPVSFEFDPGRCLATDAVKDLRLLYAAALHCAVGKLRQRTAVSAGNLKALGRIERVVPIEDAALDAAPVRVIFHPDVAVELGF